MPARNLITPFFLRHVLKSRAKAKSPYHHVLYTHSLRIIVNYNLDKQKKTCEGIRVLFSLTVFGSSLYPLVHREKKLLKPAKLLIKKKCVAVEHFSSTHTHSHTHTHAGPSPVNCIIRDEGPANESGAGILLNIIYNFFLHVSCVCRRRPVGHQSSMFCFNLIMLIWLNLPTFSNKIHESRINYWFVSGCTGLMCE